MDVRIVPSGAATGLSTQSAANTNKGTGSGDESDAGTLLPLEAPMILRSEREFGFGFARCVVRRLGADERTPGSGNYLFVDL